VFWVIRFVLNGICSLIGESMEVYDGGLWYG